MPRKTPARGSIRACGLWRPKPKKDPPPIQFDPEEMQEKPDSGPEQGPRR